MSFDKYGRTPEQARAERHRILVQVALGAAFLAGYAALLYFVALVSS